MSVENFSNIKFRENPLSMKRVVQCRRKYKQAWRS